MKVLIAEDNPIWRQMLKQNVSNWGYEPVVAEERPAGVGNFAAARRAAAGRSRLADAAYGRHRRLPPRERQPDAALHVRVMLTSRDAEEDMVAGLDAGADDYLTKPVEPKSCESRLAAAQRIVEVVPPQGMVAAARAGLRRQKAARQRRVRHRLGSGAERHNRRVALKIIRVDLATDEVFRAICPRDPHRRATGSSAHRADLRQPHRPAVGLLSRWN